MRNASLFGILIIMTVCVIKIKEADAQILAENEAIIVKVLKLLEYEEQGLNEFEYHQLRAGSSIFAHSEQGIRIIQFFEPNTRDGANRFILQTKVKKACNSIANCLENERGELWLFRPELISAENALGVTQPNEPVEWEELSQVLTLVIPEYIYKSKELQIWYFETLREEIVRPSYDALFSVYPKARQKKITSKRPINSNTSMKSTIGFPWVIFIFEIMGLGTPFGAPSTTPGSAQTPPGGGQNSEGPTWGPAYPSESELFEIFPPPMINGRLEVEVSDVSFYWAHCMYWIRYSFRVVAIYPTGNRKVVREGRRYFGPFRDPNNRCYGEPGNWVRAIMGQEPFVEFPKQGVPSPVNRSAY